VFDLVALVTRACLSDPQFEDELVSFALPVATPDIGVTSLWHPRGEADPAHRWLRDVIMMVCGRAPP